jgi:hypothetical protein
MSPLVRRALALAILLVLLLAAWSAVVLPLLGFADERLAEIDTLSDRLAGLRSTIRRIPQLEQHEAALRKALDDEGGIWTGDSESIVAAAMQDRVRQAVSSSNGVVKSTSYLQGADEKGFRKVRVSFSIDASLDSVEKTLAAIEDVQPAMFVDSMTIAAPANPAPDKAPVLALEIEVTGYMWKPKE